MPASTQPLTAIPTHLITGFLGVGKTTVIRHLLQNKPANERWAVLLNEFGEIGVDASILTCQQPTQPSVFIREVPGGCMCCAAGLPMQVALNQLLRQAKPDRLLIEPTGLGHPQEVLQALSTPEYQNVLSLQKIITLVDARQLSEPRYYRHATFIQQIEIADIVIGNKQDLYPHPAQAQAQLLDFINQHAQPGTQLMFAQQGRISLSAVSGATVRTAHTSTHPPHTSGSSQQPKPPAADTLKGIIRATNTGEGFFSIGWQLATEHIFDQQLLSAFFRDLAEERTTEERTTVERIVIERIKAVCNTSAGTFCYNIVREDFNAQMAESGSESRIEMLLETPTATSVESILGRIESKLTKCLRST